MQPLRRDRGAAAWRPSLPATSTTRSCCSTTRSASSRSACSKARSVELDATGPPEAAPVVVKVKELPQQQATFGIGFSANTGGAGLARALGPQGLRPALDRAHHAELRLRPEVDRHRVHVVSRTRSLWRNLAAGQLRAARRRPTRSRNSWNGARRPLDRTRRASSASTTSRPRTPRCRARRSPTRGRGHLRELPLAEARPRQHPRAHRRQLARRCRAASATAAARETRDDEPGEEHSQRSLRQRLRALQLVPAVRPLVRRTPALEAGEVFVKQPDLGAGHDPVPRRRRRLGARLRLPHPRARRATAPSSAARCCVTGSVELEHPLSAKLPALLGAVFVDAGNAADQWRDIRPVFGYGVGVHYRSPIGPLRVDVAYGQDGARVRACT